MLKKPEIIVFAGPNGSGKSTITKMANIIEPYINADDIKRTNHCGDLEAAQIADRMRNRMVDECRGFTFETVLSTERNINLLEKAKLAGFFIHICDICHIYDNSDRPFRIFKKRKNKYFFWNNEFWNEQEVADLVHVKPQKDF